MDGTVLVADDDRTIRTVLTQALTRAGCRVHATSSLVTLMRWVEEGRGDLVITDVIMPDGNGLENIPQISDHRPDLPVIVISAQNTIMTAIQANEAEAFDYLPKPFDLPDLMKRANRALGIKRKRIPQPEQPAVDEGQDLPLVGRTPAMQTLYRLIARVMNADLPILITGESGTGKTLIARAIHDLSDRRGLPFVTTSGSELTGPESVISLVNRVGSGTLLFDEIGELNHEAQRLIVQLLDNLNADGPRVFSTSQTGLQKKLEDGGFRQDLYYRISGLVMPVPALRDRVEDVPYLVEHFLARAVHDGHQKRSCSAEAMQALRAHPWPGNVRQLETVVRTLTITGSEVEISAAEIEPLLKNVAGSEASAGSLPDADRLSSSIARHLQRYFDLHGGQLPPNGLYQRILREMEVPLIEIALEATGGNQIKCAELLGLNRNTLRKKINDHDIRVTRRRKLM